MEGGSPVEGLRRLQLNDWPLTLHWAGATDEHVTRAGLTFPRSRKKRSALTSILTELVLANRCRQKVSYSRQASAYTGRSRYGLPGCTLTHVVGVIDLLRCQALVEEERTLPGQRGQRSRVWASPRLIAIFQDFKNFEYHAVEEIRFKDSEKKLIAYDDTEEIVRMRSEMQGINRALMKLNLGASTINLTRDVLWSAEGKPIIPAKIQSHRVFNVDILHGGRVYGGFWQQMSGDERRALTIEGLSVVEPDFPNLHPTLLQAAHRVVTPCNLYEVPDIDRKHVKRAWNIMLNCRSEQAAVQALSENINVDRTNALRIIRAVARRSKAVSSSLYSGRGLELQRHDSDLLLTVLADCHRDGFMCLPVHDSFVVQHTKEGRVREFMETRLYELITKLRS